MNRRLFILVAGGLYLATGARAAVFEPQPQAPHPWLERFQVTPGDVATVGENAYFILKPGYQLTLEGKDGDRAIRLVVTVLDETKDVGGFETRIVEERETEQGVLTEVSRNYYAIEKGTNSVYYFGEDVDVYEGGKVVKHEGAWLHGTNGARFGLMMPGAPTVGFRYHQERAPKVAMDRAEIVSVTDRITTPAGTFEKCVKTEETTPLEPKSREWKVYAPGVGLVKDGPLQLTGRAFGR